MPRNDGTQLNTVSSEAIARIGSLLAHHDFQSGQNAVSSNCELQRRCVRSRYNNATRVLQANCKPNQKIKYTVQTPSTVNTIMP